MHEILELLNRPVKLYVMYHYYSVVIMKKPSTTGQYFLIQPVVKKNDSFVCKHWQAMEEKTTTSKPLQQNHSNKVIAMKSLQ